MEIDLTQLGVSDMSDYWEDGYEDPWLGLTNEYVTGLEGEH